MRRVKPLILFALAIVMAMSAPVMAQQKPLPTREDLRNLELFRDYFASAVHRARISRTLTNDERNLTPDCSAVTVGELADFHPYGPVKFTPDEKLESGLWLEVWNVTVCGEAKRRSVLLVARDGKLNAMPFLPGRTNVDPILGRDLLPRTHVSARLYVGQQTGTPCASTPQLFDTKLVMLPRDARVDIEKAPGDVAAYLQENVSEVWRENWYLRACGHVAELKIMFMIKKDGGTTFNITRGEVTPIS
ncbi:MAG: hypothetical protein ACE363_13460 [Alphaproteobacteria bacterium]